MYSKLFHKDVYLPEGANEICNKYQGLLTKYFLSKHFKEHIENQASENRSHTYLPEVIEKCLKTLKNSPRDVFEVELSKDYRFFGKAGWFVTKYCCRIPYSDTQDLVVAIRPKYDGSNIVDNMIVTAWMNSNTDHHVTLDESKYCSKAEWESR